MNLQKTLCETFGFYIHRPNMYAVHLQFVPTELSQDLKVKRILNKFWRYLNPKLLAYGINLKNSGRHYMTNRILHSQLRSFVHDYKRKYGHSLSSKFKQFVKNI